MQPYEYWKKSPTLDLVFTTFLWSLPKFPYVSIEWAAWRWDHMTSWASHDALVMVVPMEQWAGQPFQDKSADLWVVMLSDHNETYSDRMERSYKAFAVTFELRFPFPLKIRRSWDRIIFNMGIPILVRWHLYIETAPRSWCHDIKHVMLLWPISMLDKKEMDGHDYGI